MPAPASPQWSTKKWYRWAPLGCHLFRRAFSVTTLACHPAHSWPAKHHVGKSGKRLGRPAYVTCVEYRWVRTYQSGSVSGGGGQSPDAAGTSRAAEKLADQAPYSLTKGTEPAPASVALPPESEPQ